MSYKRRRAVFEADGDDARRPAHAPFVLYGTPLPAYDRDARDDGSYVPLWKQEVRDEQGRKRLHGAFTGGWSAGYFNTVGSKEGWTPSTFVSSRSQRASQQGKDEGQQQQRPMQRVEDFMDEEDLREAEEARTLHVAGGYAGLGGVQGQGQEGADEASVFGTHKSALMGLFKPSGDDSVGIQLLKRMGWREGQGIGPLVRRRARLGTGHEDDGMAGNTQETHLFAPDDTPIVQFANKLDRKGLGFAGEEKLSGTSSLPSNGRAMLRLEDRSRAAEDDDDRADPFARLTTQKSSARDKTSRPAVRKPARGIGVGVLNSDDEDEDPYEITPRLSYNRVIDGDRKSKTSGLAKKKQLAANPLLPTKPVFVKRKPGAGPSEALDADLEFRRCRDGCLPLEGFLLSTELSKMSLGEAYPPPPVPDGWKPRGLLQQQEAASATATGTAPATESGGDLAHRMQRTSDPKSRPTASLDPAARAAILGEKPLPGPSIYDFMTPEARARIAKVTGRTDLPPAGGQRMPPVHAEHTHPSSRDDAELRRQREAWSFVPYLDRLVAQQALERGNAGPGSFMPYAEDEAKRARYRAFLALKARLPLPPQQQTHGGEELPGSDRPPEQPPGMSTQEWIAEMNEFVRCAMVFRPSSGLIASRFTSASGGSAARPTTTAAPASHDSLLRLPPSKEKQLTPAEQAAQMGMYGHLTREVVPFEPSRLLCKRFGVPVPVPTDAGNVESQASSGPDQLMAATAATDATAAVPPTTQAPASRAQLLSAEAMDRIIADANASQAQNGRDPNRPVIGLRKPVVIDPERNEALERPRPADDVFKAVFGSDDEDADGDAGFDD
ncbi:hypothetical protein KEM52_005392 [Ascosphaera acerosa]|nr:hypothetical protein KEM52_005392 [Ascosphaera acerosa]